MENIDTSAYDVSQIGIQFGPDFESEAKTSLKFDLSFSSDEIKKQTELLKTLSKSPNDLTHSFVFEFPVDSPESQAILSSAFEVFLNNKGLTGHVDKETMNTVLLVVKLSPEKEESLLQPLKFLIGQGLNTLCKENQSHLTVSLASACDFKDLMPFLADNESFLCTLLQSAKLEIKLALAKNLIDGLSKVFNKIDPDFNNSPPMILMKYFKNVDVDLRFQSTRELPQNVRNTLFASKILLWISAEMRFLLEKMPAKVKGFLVIPDFMVGKIELNLPNTTIFVREYLELLK